MMKLLTVQLGAADELSANEEVYRTVSVVCPVSAGQPVSVSAAAAAVRCANASSTGDAGTHDDLCVKLVENAAKPQRKGALLIKPNPSYRFMFVLF